MMTEKKVDRRALRTEKAIRKAFEELLMADERPITVASLARHADINRKTFYLHYDTIDDLVNSYLDDARSELMTRLNAHSVDEYFSEPSLLMGVYADFFSQNERFYSYVLFQDEYWPRVRQLEDEIVRTMATKLAQARQISFSEALLLVTFATSTMLNMLRLRLRGDIDLTPEQLRSKITELNLFGINGALGLDKK